VLAIAAMLAIAACGGTTDRDRAARFDAATAALRAGDLQHAESEAAAGLTLTSDPASLWAWRFKLLKAEALIGRRRLDEAAPFLTDSIPADNVFDDIRARQKFLAARVQLARGDLPSALATCDEASKMPAGGDVRADIANLAGQILFQLGRAAEGEGRLDSALADARTRGDRYHEAFALNQLGMGQLVASRFDQAAAFFERVLAIDGQTDTAIYARALYNAGICYSRLGLFERAAALQTKAAALAERRGALPDLEHALGELGNTAVLRGRATEALPYYERALQVARDARAEADAALWAGNIATAYIELHRWDDADRYNEEAIRASKASGRGPNVYHVLNTASIAEGRGDLKRADVLFQQALASADAPPSVLWEAHAGAAQVALGRSQPAAAARHFESALTIIERTRAGLLKTDYKISYLTSLIAFYQAYVDALVDEGQIERALEVADSSRARVLAERQGGQLPPRLQAAQLRAISRRTGVVFLSYWLAPEASSVWVVSRDGVKRVALPPAAEIDAKVEQHRAAIANVLADPATVNDTGRRLFDLLIGPVKAALPAGARVVIVPDGTLHGVNFETLVTGDRPHFWIEDAEVQIAPSLAAVSVEASARPASLLLIGDATPRPPEYPALTYSRAEMTSVAGRFAADRVERIEGASASPDAYRGARPDRFAFIHFTAHASANVESPLDSAVILSGPDDRYKLYARDVADQRLNAELVTVSACRSAGERAYSGEGLIGFSWAFLRAGARRVVAGLWDVDDRSTADLMSRMYESLAAGEPPARALRLAKLALLQQGGASARPYNWAPFELFTTAL
jgi:CHAT domain-containing protein